MKMPEGRVPLARPFCHRREIANWRRFVLSEFSCGPLVQAARKDGVAPNFHEPL